MPEDIGRARHDVVSYLISEGITACHMSRWWFAARGHHVSRVAVTAGKAVPAPGSGRAGAFVYYNWN